MSKELIFMGRSQGKVRLALFDGSNGEARKLPVKEISEEVFIAGIKTGNVPVRGFGTNRGRLTCAYGNWNSLPEITQKDGVTLFGTVSFKGKNCVVSSAKYDSKFQETVVLDWCGIASISWQDGMFRVLSPSTLAFMLYQNTDMMVYQYRSASSGSKAKGSGYYRLKKGDTADYSFNECVSREPLQSVLDWAGIGDNSLYAFLQWAYQRCERIAVSVKCLAELEEYMRCGYAKERVYLALLGSSALDEVRIPFSLRKLCIADGRKIGVYSLLPGDGVALYSDSAMVINCSKVAELVLAQGTYAYLIRDANSVPISITGWEGSSEYNGNYCGLNIEALRYSFNIQPDEKKLVFDAKQLNNSLCKIDVDVELTERMDSIWNSFRDYTGSLTWKGAKMLNETFVRCKMRTPLDLREVDALDSAVNDVAGTIICPDYFKRLSYYVFNKTSITSVKYVPEGIAKVCLNLRSPKLSVELFSDTKEVAYCYTDVASTHIHYLRDIAPTFEDVTSINDNTLSSVKIFEPKTFTGVRMDVLDLRKFPNVTLLPKALAHSCNFTTIIVGDNVSTIEKNAFIACNCIRWVYIPKGVKTVESFVQFPRFPYTIFTQKGSAADLYARTKKYEVRYVDGVDEFMKAINEIPEELEGITAVATFMGEKSQEEGIIKLACSERDFAPNLYDVCIINEACAIPIEQVKWAGMGSYKKAKDKCGAESPRSHLLLSHINNIAKCNPLIKDILTKDTCMHVWYAVGDYVVGYAVLCIAGGKENAVWVVVKDDIVVNMFTESLGSSTCVSSTKRLLELALATDASGEKPTDINSLINHLHFIGNGYIGMHGKSVGGKGTQIVKQSIEKTYVPLGLYQSGKKGRCVVCADVTTLELAAFNISSGKKFEDKSVFYRDAFSFWNKVSTTVGNICKIEKIDNLVRFNGLFGGGDKVVNVILGIDVVKVTEYNTQIPQMQTESIAVLTKAIKERDSDMKTITGRGFCEALRASGLARPLSISDAKQIEKDKRYANLYDERIQLKDGDCRLYSMNKYRFWCEFDCGDKLATLKLALSKDNFINVVKALHDLYENLTIEAPEQREGHYAHMNVMLPHQDFVKVRVFDSGGLYSRAGTFSVCVAVSRVSGKVCVASTCYDGITPLFWTDSIAAAFRILEVCGMLAFSFRTEWLSKAYSSLCSGVYSSKENYDLKKPDFDSFFVPWKTVRDALRRGENADYICVNGEQEIFSLALKHPPVSDLGL